MTATVEEPVDLTPLEFTEFAIYIKGEPIQLGRRPWLPHIYNLPVTVTEQDELRRKILLVTGRQSEKSTTLGNLLISLASLISYLRCLYVTASDVQLREFSDERLRAVIQDSPVLQQLTGSVPVIRGTGDHREVQNVLTKRWQNQAKIVLRSVYKSADRARGLPADVLAIDEIQDIRVDDIPVLEETLFRCELEDGPLSVYAGTPKTFSNSIEFYWARFSTQNEWLTKCSFCGHWNVVDEKNIGNFGLICSKCAKEINPVDDRAQWVRFGKRDAEWEGFHLCQPIVVYTYRDRPKIFDRLWKGIIQKKARYSRARFINEVMGRSYDYGAKPVSLAEVRACCRPDESFMIVPDRKIKHTLTWGGVDWGQGDESYTIFSIWKYDSGGRFCLVYAKRYEGIEATPEYAVKHIIDTAKAFNVDRIGADWGFGFGMNSRLKQALGASKVLCYFHSMQAGKVVYDKSRNAFVTHRTQVLQDIFTLIKRGPVSGGIAFPKWEESETFLNDILAVYQDESKVMRQMIFDHPRGVPDDFLHTACYAFLVSQFDHPRRDLHSPDTSTPPFTTRRR